MPGALRVPWQNRANPAQPLTVIASGAKQSARADVPNYLIAHVDNRDKPGPSGSGECRSRGTPRGSRERLQLACKVMMTFAPAGSNFRHS